MNPVSLSELAGWCGVSFAGDGGHIRVTRLCRDTRALQPGDLYLALRGERFDGNDFVGRAAELGAVGAVIERAGMPAPRPDFPMIVVGDTLRALHGMAEQWRARLGARVVCVTGSSGKTTTKDFIAAVLGARHRVTRTTGNLNNHIGLPLTILEAQTEDAFAVWEIGMNHPGEIAPLARLARPDIGVITNIGVAHIEFMGSREGIAAEKGALLEALASDGLAVLPAEDEFFGQLSAKAPCRTLGVGLARGDVRATGLELGANGTTFKIERGGDSVAANLPVAGEHMVRNALLAVAVGLECGMELAECAAALGSVTLTGGRMQRREVKGLVVLDDTYNANPDSMTAALRALKGLPAAGGRRIAALGRMGELGDHAAEGYRRVGLETEGIDVLITVGEEAAAIGEGSEGRPGKVLHVDSNREAAGLLRTLARPGDLLLVKGSRAAKMEELIALLK